MKCLFCVGLGREGATGRKDKENNLSSSLFFTPDAPAERG